MVIGLPSPKPEVWPLMAQVASCCSSRFQVPAQAWLTITPAWAGVTQVVAASRLKPPMNPAARRAAPCLFVMAASFV